MILFSLLGYIEYENLLRILFMSLGAELSAAPLFLELAQYEADPVRALSRLSP
jgi:hypothetical protein